MNDPPPAAQPRSFKNKTLQYTLVSSFLLASVVLWISHHAVISSSAIAGDKQHQLLSVPLPRRQAAAHGGLPPVPDFVEQKLDEELERLDNLDDGNNDAAADDVPAFPLPSDSPISLKPTFGKHRPNKNAVFAFAEGYEIGVYVTFIESLKQTNFTGDVVLAVSYVKGMKPGVAEYLKWYSEQGDGSLRVISYALEWECYKKSGVRIATTNSEGRGSTTNHGFSDCVIHNLYSDGKDTREARPVATARYELYYIFSKQYRETSSILIIDARDAYFQSNPFTFSASPSLDGVHLPANQQRNSKQCRLDLFEENYEAVNIGKSQYNSRWIKSAYGQKALKRISAKPVVCSGSTMGTQKAIELYSVAMVAQFDKTKCKQVGCDQGFHNYLYYEGGLEPYLASNGCVISVHKQGSGAVNNLAAMRESSLRSQGVLASTGSSAEDKIVVFNNDKTTPSPVVHQFDRDKELKIAIRKRTSKMVNQWKSSQK